MTASRTLMPPQTKRISTLPSLSSAMVGSSSSAAARRDRPAVEARDGPFVDRRPDDAVGHAQGLERVRDRDQRVVRQRQESVAGLVHARSKYATRAARDVCFRHKRVAFRAACVSANGYTSRGRGGRRMKSHARVVVIGGGAVGVSTLYHLAHKGWSDVVLVERAELTAGSTWHAAGLLPLFNMSYTVGQLHKYSVDLYKRLPAETGQDVSFHVTGNLRLATSRDRMDEYRKYCGTANTIGVPFEIIGPKQVKELWPLLELGGTADTAAIIGGLYHPHDGHIAPADLTMALRKGARAKGAEIYEQTEVTAVTRTRSRRVEAHDDEGRDHGRARRLRDRQLRAPDREDVRPQRAGDPGRAPVHRLRGIAGAESLPPGRRARAAGDARARPVVLPARGAPGLDPRALRGRRARRASPTACRPGSARACSTATSSGSSRTSRARSGACRRSRTAASRTSSTARFPTRRTAAR